MGRPSGAGPGSFIISLSDYFIIFIISLFHYQIFHPFIHSLFVSKKEKKEKNKEIIFLHICISIWKLFTCSDSISIRGTTTVYELFTNGARGWMHGGSPY